MSRQQKTGCNNNSRLLWTLFRSCCAVVWPGLEKVVWRRICEEEAFDLRSGNTLSLAVTNTYFSGLRGVSYRFQVGHNYQNFTHLHGEGGFHVLPLVPSEVFVFPSPLPNETGDRNYKEGMALWKARISSLLWANGGLWSIHSSIKRRLGWRGREKSMLTQKGVLSIAGNPHGCKIVT